MQQHNEKNISNKVGWSAEDVKVNITQKLQFSLQM